MIHDAVIVGTGFGGMGAAIALRRLGHDDLVMLEREDDLGGTWNVNRYPGLAVDIPSATYSYSFEPNPYWSRLYAPGRELKAYCDHVATTYDLRRHMRFGVNATGAEWDEDAKAWTVHVEGGEPVRGRFLLTATGFLSQPKLPDIEGIDSFAGTVLHTTQWDDDVELEGRRAAVIGTGATAVQLIPEIAPRLAELTVFQRTAIWVTPKSDAAVPRRLQRLYARVPLTQRIARDAGSAVLEAVMVAGVLKYRQLHVLNSLAARLATRHLERQVKDPETRRKLTPDYSFGCKRPTFSNTYYPTFNEPHVHLETTPIDRVEPDAIVTTDGTRHEVDTLVLATGFDLWGTNFPAFRIVGREGRDLGAWWRENRFQAYEGIAVPKMPNFFTLNSPYSYSGLSYFTTIESQMKHMTRLLTAMAERGATEFEVTEEANDAFLDRMTERLGDSVFALGSCSTSRSYYFNQHGEATLLRPTSTLNAFREAGRFPLEDYALT
ncbi:monooxygenase [Aeromicrobium sp. Root495]|uniref:flavin-containing monooxygenase n=1 Tax=Aeromicrobium sp. Root495 TaxID=1736550 RepID=UPI0006F84FB9|nr:NAD(P)/FAD-dependent oxidoreductase [Aeromicrobium sp. Root495]KQY56019.1 monooxygenase [Aeromicrobium sp. Root495]RYJ07477.1 MAG: NAD(P)/FAD-dependent oxidoreductase [Actinomycetales bacterium]